MSDNRNSPHLISSHPDEQASGEIQLEGNRTYYLEGIAVKHGQGDDHFSVGVQLPSGRLVRPITEDLMQQTRPCKSSLFLLCCC